MEKYIERLVAKPGSFRKVGEAEMNQMKINLKLPELGSGLARGCRLNPANSVSDWIFVSNNRKNLIAAEEYGHWDTKHRHTSLQNGVKCYLFPTNSVIQDCKSNQKEIFGWEFEVDKVEEISEQSQQVWWGDLELENEKLHSVIQDVKNMLNL